MSGEQTIEHTARIVSTYVSNHQMPKDDLAGFIKSIDDALKGSAPVPPPTPAVPIGKSISDDHIVCLEDGAKLRMLKRYLRSQHDMSPEEYRKKWGLPPDYPMVAPAYARLRSAFAKKIGLGTVPARGKRS